MLIDEETPLLQKKKRKLEEGVAAQEHTTDAPLDESARGLADDFHIDLVNFENDDEALPTDVLYKKLKVGKFGVILPTVCIVW